MFLQHGFACHDRDTCMVATGLCAATHGIHSRLVAVAAFYGHPMGSLA